MAAVGIDLGTTNSCVAVLSSTGIMQILPNDIGKNTTPSIVAFKNNGEILIGQEAKNQMPLNPKNTLFGIKRLIGYKYDDEDIQEDMKKLPFKVIPGKDRRAAVQVSFNGEDKVYTPEEISSFILLKLKNTASAGTSEPIKKAVITVPAYFSASQRQSTKDAGKIAGLDVLGIISEPTAAAIAYGIGTSSKSKRVVFVFDFGGGTLDCTLMKVENGSYDVLATSGDTHLGGEDIDNALVDFAAKEFKKTTKIDIRNEKYLRQLAILKLECEKVKCALAAPGIVQQKLQIRSFVDGKDLDINITRAAFEFIVDEIFNKIHDPIETVFDDLSDEMDKDIDPKTFVTDVIMVGGSSKIPYVAKTLEEYFGRKPIFGVDPDTAVASGAAMYAASLAGATKGFKVNENLEGAEKPDKPPGLIVLIDPSKITDVVPLSLGIEVSTGEMSVIIKNNTSVPHEETKTYTTADDYQTAVTIKVFEGQREIAKENRILGNFTVSGLTSRLRGETKIDVTFKINKENLLDVSVVESGGSANKKVQLKNDIGHLTKAEIEKMEREAEMYIEADRKRVENNKAANELDYLINKATREKGSDPLVRSITNEVTRWKDSNPSADASEILSKIDELKRKLKPCITL
jgi:heat shock protein 1/8